MRASAPPPRRVSPPAASACRRPLIGRRRAGSRRGGGVARRGPRLGLARLAPRANLRRERVRATGCAQRNRRLRLLASWGIVVVHCSELAVVEVQAGPHESVTCLFNTSAADVLQRGKARCRPWSSTTHRCSHRRAASPRRGRANHRASSRSGLPRRSARHPPTTRTTCSVRVPRDRGSAPVRDLATPQTLLDVWH